jgi:hypothetical protein
MVGYVKAQPGMLCCRFTVLCYYFVTYYEDEMLSFTAQLQFFCYVEIKCVTID